jgi:plastocyanin
MNANNLTMLRGETAQLTATPLNGTGQTMSGAPKAVWSSTAPAVASVDADGLVTATGNGAASITATISGAKGTTQVTVAAPALTATVSMPGLSFAPFTTVIRVGGTVRFEFPQLPHNVIFSAKAGAPADILPIASTVVSRTFGTAGVFPYDCTLHPGMKGEVSVVP